MQPPPIELLFIIQTIILLFDIPCPVLVVVIVPQKSYSAKAVHYVVLLGVVVALIGKHGAGGSRAKGNSVIGLKKSTFKL